MKNATVILGPGVDAAFLSMVDYVPIDEVATVIAFLDRIQQELISTLSTSPLGGPRFQGDVRMFTVESYTFLYEYHPGKGEVHVLDMKAPGQDWR